MELMASLVKMVHPEQLELTVSMGVMVLMVFLVKMVNAVTKGQSDHPGPKDLKANKDSKDLKDSQVHQETLFGSVIHQM